MAKIKTRSKKTLEFINYEELEKVKRSNKKIFIEFSLVELYAIYTALRDIPKYTEKDFNLIIDKKKKKELQEMQSKQSEVMRFLSKIF